MVSSGNKKGTGRTIAILLAATLFIAFGVWSFWQRYQITHNPNVTIPAETVIHSTDTPDETPPGKVCDDYKVADNEPRKIEIPAIGVSGCIQKVGIDQHGAIAAPTNIHLAGWYVNSALPGERGISVIDGHVSGRYHNALFAELKDIKTGDTIRIQYGDGTWKEFEAADTKSYPVDEVMDYLFDPLDGADSQLVLITCGGNFDRQSQAYDERVIVRAGIRENNP